MKANALGPFRLAAWLLAVILAPSFASAQVMIQPGMVNFAPWPGSVTLDTTSGNAFRGQMSVPTLTSATKDDGSGALLAGVYQITVVGVDLAGGTSLYPTALSATCAGGTSHVDVVYVAPVGAASVRVYVSAANGATPIQYFTSTSPTGYALTTLAGATVAALPTANTAYRYNLGTPYSWTGDMFAVASGAATTPSWGFIQEQTLGWYRPVAGTMGLAVSNAERLRFSAVTSGGLLEVLDAGGTGGYGLSTTIGTPDWYLHRQGTATGGIVGSLGVTGQVLARESFKQPHIVREEDFTAKVVTDAGINVVLGSPSGIVQYREEGAKADAAHSSWLETTTGLDIQGDAAIDDDDGVEIYLGDGADTSTGWIVTGTTGACFSVNFSIALIAGTDQFTVGWRKNEAWQDNAAYTGYDDWSVVGINNIDGSIFSMGEVLHAGTLSDDSGVNAANADVRTFKSCISAAGVPSAFYTANAGTSFTSITMTTSGTAKTAGIQMNPFISFRQASGAIQAAIKINWWEITKP